MRRSPCTSGATPATPRCSSGIALGADASGQGLDLVAQRLAAGLRVLAVDGPGFGGSPLLRAEAYGLDMLAALVQRLVATLDLEPLFVMGHSWGGASRHCSSSQRCRRTASRTERTSAVSRGRSRMRRSGGQQTRATASSPTSAHHSATRSRRGSATSAADSPPRPVPGTGSSGVPEAQRFVHIHRPDSGRGTARVASSVAGTDTSL